MRQFLEDFKAHNIRRKFCLISSWIAATGGVLLIGSSAVTLIYWANDNEPTPLTKASMFAGLGLLFGGTALTTGLALEDDRASELDANRIWAEIELRRAAREASRCQNCKFFSNHSDLYCAINPSYACTIEAESCVDFEEKSYSGENRTHQ